MNQQVFEPSRRRLGRGLSALLGGQAPAHEVAEGAAATASDGELRYVPIHVVSRNPWQPRKEFEVEALGELAASIKEHGVLQPLLVREIDGGYQLIAGERRWLAAQRAGVESVPCRVLDVIDKTACEFALEENLKRKDLSDLEKAHAFKEYLSQFQCTIEELSKQLSMSRSTVSNILRLLDLCEPVRNALQTGKITSGHGRALLALEDAEQLALCNRIQAENLNVRQTEAAVKEHLGRGTPERPAESAALPADVAPTDAVPADAVPTDTVPADTVSADAASPSPESESPSQETADVLPIESATPNDSHVTNHVRDLQEQLRQLLGTPVEIRLSSKDSGQIVIPFAGNSEFERILGTLRSSRAA